MISPLQEAAAVGQPWALRDLPPFPWITTKVLQLYSEEGEELDVVPGYRGFDTEGSRKPGMVGLGMAAETKK